MKVVNIHTRTVPASTLRIGELLKTLSSPNDRMLATDKWPPMRLDRGLTIGSRGGHGPIGYFVEHYKPAEFIQFRFTTPAGFHGVHAFEITAVGHEASELTHTVAMHTTGLATIKWLLAIRWLHDAFIEDALDKVESQFTTDKKKRTWNMWVIFLRKAFKPTRTHN